MKPYPFSLLNHFTVPPAIRASADRVRGSSPPSMAREPIELGGMRLVTYSGRDGEPRAGVHTDTGMIDAAAALGLERVSIRELLENGRLGDLPGTLEGREPASVAR